MKLIDKDKIVSEIESIYQETNYEPFTDEVLGKRIVCKKILDFLDTLEVKEISEEIREDFVDGYWENKYKEIFKKLKKKF